jgi:hypothetical protein
VLLAAVLAAVAVGMPATAYAARPAALGTGNPATSTGPSSAFRNACGGIDNSSQSASDACEHAAAYDFSSVWSDEGITQSFALPAGFDTMTVPDQLLAITNLERSARGLTQVAGRSAALDSIAQDGADNDADPALPTSPWRGDSEASNWAGAGNSVLLDDFYWMYDDGLGSPNGDCTAADTTWCWGHRDNILGSYDSPLMMGAAVAYGTPAGTSMTELFIGGDTMDVPTTGSGGSGPAGGSVPPALTLSSRSVSLTTQLLSAATKQVTATATGGSLAVAAAITSGAGSWKVSPTSCTATPSVPCVFTVTFKTTGGPGAHNGTLALRSSAGTQTVALNGALLQPDLKVAISRTGEKHGALTVARGHRFTVSGTVLTAHDERRIPHARVVLETRASAHGRWHSTAVKHSDSRGKVRFTPMPKLHRSRYRMVVTSSTKAVEIVSVPFHVAVD